MLKTEKVAYATQLEVSTTLKGRITKEIYPGIQGATKLGSLPIFPSNPFLNLQLHPQYLSRAPIPFLYEHLRGDTMHICEISASLVTRREGLSVYSCSVAL